MTHVTCRLTAKNRDQLRNPRLGNRVCATFTYLLVIKYIFAKLFCALSVVAPLAPPSSVSPLKRHRDPQRHIILISFLMYRKISPATKNTPLTPEGIRASVHWVHLSERPKLHIDCVSHSSTELAVVFNRHTDRQTHKHTHRQRYVSRNRPHLCTPCMRCGLIIGKRKTGAATCNVTSVQRFVAVYNVFLSYYFMTLVSQKLFNMLRQLSEYWRLV